MFVLIRNALRERDCIDPEELHKFLVKSPLRFVSNAAVEVARDEIHDEGALLRVGHRREGLDHDLFAAVGELLLRSLVAVSPKDYLDAIGLAEHETRRHELEPHTDRPLGGPELRRHFRGQSVADRVPNFGFAALRPIRFFPSVEPSLLLLREVVAARDERLLDLRRGIESTHPVAEEHIDSLELQAFVIRAS